MRAAWVATAVLLVVSVLVGIPPGSPVPAGAEEGGPPAAYPAVDAQALGSKPPVGTWTERSVYWTTTRDCGEPADEFPPVCAFHVSAGPGYTGSTYFRNSSGLDGDNIASNLAWGTGGKYWANARGEILRLSSSYDDPAVVTTTVADVDHVQVAADGGHVYWVENVAGDGHVYRAPNTGGTPELMYENTRPITDLRVDGEGGVLFLTDVFVFVCCVDLLQRVVPTGSGFAVDHVDFQGTESYSVSDHGTVYFITSMGSGGAPQLREAPLDDLGDDVLWHELDPAGDPSWPILVAGPGSTVFWQQVHLGEGPLVRLHTGGTPQVITGNLVRAVDAQTTGYDDEYLAVLTAGEVWRYPTDLPTRRLDLVGDELGLEVVQATQSAAHDVPLVAGKQTFARLYGRIAESSEGIGRLSMFPNGVLRGYRGGVELPGSPLVPVQDPALQDVPAVQRTDLETTILFELPETWTHGDVTLRGEVNANRSELEVDYSNNVSERTVTFETERGICLDMLPVLTTSGPSEDGFTPEILEHFQRTKSMYPTASLGGAFRGGTPRTIPLANDPYNMFDRDHKNMLLMNLTTEFMFSSAPAQCGGRHTIRTVYVPDSDRFGLSNAIAPNIYAMRRDGGDFPENVPNGAVDGLAHEVGHQFGISHIACPAPGMTGAPDGPYETYPYNPCVLDDSNNHIGFDGITRSLIVPQPGGGAALPSDFMTYQTTLNWTSDYSYRKIFRQLATGAALGPVGGSGTGTTDGGSPSATVLGGYLTGDGTGVLSYAFDAAETAPLVTATIADRTTPSSDHEVRVFDGADLVSSTPLNVSHTHVETERDGTEPGSDPEESLLFLHALDPATPMTRIEIVDLASGTVLLDRTAGLAAPSVSVTTPVAGEVVGDTMDLRWSASDADGDPLAHTVRYSTDGGTTWTALGTNLTDTQLTVDMTTMPGSADAMVEVIASDGLHSTSARVGPFEVATHGPDLLVMTESFDALDATTPATFRQSDDVVVRGYGYDAEDGELSDADLRWTLTGAVTRTGSGTVFRATELPPGTYDLELTGTDADGESTTATTQVLVQPKLIGTGAPTLDGRCGDVGYETDTDPIVLRLPDGRIAGVRAVHDGDALYACLAGLPATPGSTDEAEVRLDLDGDGGTTVGSRELFFRVNSLGDVGAGHGEAGSDVFTAADGVEAEVMLTGAAWNAELRIPDRHLDPHEAVVGLRASVTEDVAGTGSTVAWPPGSTAKVPGSWGAATFGAGGLLVDATGASGREGEAIPLHGSVSGADGVTTSWSMSAGAPCDIADETALDTTITCTDDGAFTVTLAATADGETRFADAVVSVSNAAPVIETLSIPIDPVEAGAEVPVEVAFDDAGSSDSHTCRIDWGDGTSPSTVDGTAGECATSHTYTEPGTYVVEIRVADDDGGADGETVEYLVVYDPSAGFVTGGGWIDSPPGAYRSDPELAGRATFGFNSRYRRGAHTPRGSTEFRFRAAGLEFRSTEHQWLVVAGARAQYKGSGTINGAPGYDFLVSVVDGQLPGGGDLDRFRIKIWDRSTDEIVYDNQAGSEDDATATTALGGGSIVIHRGR